MGKINEGQFGKIYLYDYKNQKKAVKRLKLKPHSNAFEALMSSLHHPFIAPLEAVYQDKETLCQVFPFYQGGDLGFRLEAEYRFKLEDTRFYAAQIYEALRYLHDKHILYRDLKWHNIMVDDLGYIRLIDFDFAKQF